MFGRAVAGKSWTITSLVIFAIFAGRQPVWAQSSPDVPTEDQQRLCPLVAQEFVAKILQAMKGMEQCKVWCSGCGCKGGPGYRSKATDHCVGWAEIVSVCGPPPHEGCSRECEPVVAGCTGRAWIKALAAKLGSTVTFLPGEKREKARSAAGPGDGGVEKFMPDAPEEGVPTGAVEPGGAAAACGTKRTCKEMSSCDEARHYLIDCGLKRLDGDGDGVPCNSLCKGR